MMSSIKGITVCWMFFRLMEKTASKLEIVHIKTTRDSILFIIKGNIKRGVSCCQRHVHLRRLVCNMVFQFVLLLTNADDWLRSATWANELTSKIMPVMKNQVCLTRFCMVNRMLHMYCTVSNSVVSQKKNCPAW